MAKNYDGKCCGNCRNADFAYFMEDGLICHVRVSPDNDDADLSILMNNVCDKHEMITRVEKI